MDFLGKITTVEASEDGRPLEDVVAYSPDNTHLLEIEAGTRATDSQGNAVTNIVIRQAGVQQLPINTILAGEAYDITPSGTAFDRDISLSLGFKAEDLPDEVISIGMAYTNHGLGWTHLDSVRNQVAGVESLTSMVAHLTVFAILVEVPEEAEIVPPTDGPDIQPPAAASFVLSNLSITTSESKTWKGLTFVARYGEDAEITLDVAPGHARVSLTLDIGLENAVPQLPVRCGLLYKLCLERPGEVFAHPRRNIDHDLRRNSDSTRRRAAHRAAQLIQRCRQPFG